MCATRKLLEPVSTQVKKQPSSQGWHGKKRVPGNKVGEVKTVVMLIGYGWRKKRYHAMPSLGEQMETEKRSLKETWAPRVRKNDAQVRSKNLG